MDKYAKLSRIIKGKPAPIALLLGEVIAVNGEKCSVKVADFIHEDVYLRLTDDTLTDSLLVTPALNSFVLIADLSGGENRALTVIDIESIAKIEYKKGDFSVVMDDKIKIEKGLTSIEISEAVKVKAALTEFEIDAIGVKIANATANLKPIIGNLQTNLVTILSALGLPGAAQITADIALLQTLLK